MSVVQVGDTVSVHYTTKSLEGCVIETSHPRNPVTFQAGGNEVIPGLSDAVVGMSAGETARLALPPDRGFGKRHEDLVQEVPSRFVAKDLAQGDQLLIESSAELFEAAVIREQESTLLLDANHPLAGETLVIEIEVVEVDHR